MADFRDLPDRPLSHEERPDDLHDGCECGSVERIDPWRKGFTRRRVLQGSTAIAAALGMQQVTTRMAFAAPTPGQRTLGVLFLRGGLDGMSWVVPAAEQAYYDLRGNAAVAKNELLTLDRRFGLNPNLKPFLDLWNKGQLSIIPATSTPDRTLSHFEAQDLVERGYSNERSGDGWLTRAIGTLTNLPVLSAVAHGSSVPASLEGSSALALDGIESFGLAGLDGDLRAPSAAALRKLYAKYDHPMAKTATETLGAIDAMQSLAKQKYTPKATFPDGGFSDGLQTVARLINANVGLSFFTMDMGGFDTHTNQRGQLDGHADDLSKAMGAFFTELGAKAATTTILVMSEFGRTVRANGNLGTDHGRGQAMFVLGGGANKGLHGTWPGLRTTKDFDNTLQGTVDYRSVVAEGLRWAGVSNMNAVFPDFKPATVGAVKKA